MLTLLVPKSYANSVVLYLLLWACLPRLPSLPYCLPGKRPILSLIRALQPMILTLLGKTNPLTTEIAAIRLLTLCDIWIL